MSVTNLGRLCGSAQNSVVLAKLQGMRVQSGFLFLWSIVFWVSSRPVVLAQQQCADRLTLTPVSQPNRIEWDKFPEFTVPFPIIFNGPRFDDAKASPLRHGFSHLVEIKDSEYGGLVKPAQRAVVYYGIATGLNQPWETIESPWGNDLTAYRAKWDQYLTDIAGGQKNVAGKYIFPASRFVLDVERIQETDVRILRLKQDTRVPDMYRKLSDSDFIAAYKKAIRNLYAEAAQYSANTLI